jgi:hypothetical protein
MKQSSRRGLGLRREHHSVPLRMVAEPRRCRGFSRVVSLAECLHDSMETTVASSILNVSCSRANTRSRHISSARSRDTLGRDTNCPVSENTPSATTAWMWECQCTSGRAAGTPHASERRDNSSKLSRTNWKNGDASWARGRYNEPALDRGRLSTLSADQSRRLLPRRLRRAVAYRPQNLSELA